MTRRPRPLPGGRGSRPQEKDETSEGLGRSPWEGVSSCGRPGTLFRSAESGPAARGSLTPGEGRPEAADPSGDSSRFLGPSGWPRVKRSGHRRPQSRWAQAHRGSGKTGGRWGPALVCLPPAGPLLGDCPPLSTSCLSPLCPAVRGPCRSGCGDEGGVGGALYTKQLKTGRLPSITPARMQSQSCLTLRPQGSSMGFSRQECWSGLLCPPPGDLPDPGIKPESLNISCRVLS